MNDNPLAPLDQERVQALLHTSYVGRNLIYYASTGSTNDVAQTLASSGAPEGTLVIADAQSAGRGRLGRAWVSPPNRNLLFSLLFYPPLAPVQAQRMTMLCSLAAADAIRKVTGVAVEIKWPNDLLWSGKKVAGILSEMGLRGEALAYVVVGIGLNVNLRVEEWAEPLRTLATSLAEATSTFLPREPLLAAILDGVEARYERLRRDEMPVEEWAARLVTLGKLVCVTDSNESIAALAEGVDADGALLLRLADGRQRRVLAGDVTLRPPQR